MSEPNRSEYATIAGLSEQALQDKTGQTWAQWCRRLDDLGGRSMSHRDIAQQVNTLWPEIGGWWAQTVTVGYERIRGLRVRGQQSSDQMFAASKSRTLAVALPALYRAFSDSEVRARWMSEVPTVRSGTTNKSIRFDWPDGTLVAVTFTDKGPSKSMVAVQHQELSSQADRDLMKAQWQLRLNDLASLLEVPKHGTAG